MFQTPSVLLVFGLWPPPGLETTVPALPRPALLQVRPAPQPHAWGSRGIQALPCPLCLPFSLLPSRTRKMDESWGDVLLPHPRQLQNCPESTCPACCGRGAAGAQRRETGSLPGGQDRKPSGSLLTRWREGGNPERGAPDHRAPPILGPQECFLEKSRTPPSGLVSGVLVLGCSTCRRQVVNQK